MSCVGPNMSTPDTESVRSVPKCFCGDSLLVICTSVNGGRAGNYIFDPTEVCHQRGQSSGTAATAIRSNYAVYTPCSPLGQPIHR